MVNSEKTEKKFDSDESIFKFDKRIVSNSVFSIGSTIITYGIYFIISVFLARILSVESYGSYKLVREIFKIIVIFSIPGLKLVIFKN